MFDQKQKLFCREGEYSAGAVTWKGFLSQLQTHNTVNEEQLNNRHHIQPGRSAGCECYSHEMSILLSVLYNLFYYS